MKDPDKAYFYQPDGEVVVYTDAAALKKEVEMQAARKIELYRILLRHIIGALCAIAELHLGYKIDIKG